MNDKYIILINNQKNIYNIDYFTIDNSNKKNIKYILKHNIFNIKKNN